MSLDGRIVPQPLDFCRERGILSLSLPEAEIFIMSNLINPDHFYIAIQEGSGSARERGNFPSWQELRKTSTGWYDGDIFKSDSSDEVFLTNLSDSNGERQREDELGVAVVADEGLEVWAVNEDDVRVNLLTPRPDLEISRGVTLRESDKRRQAIIINPGAEIKLEIYNGGKMVKHVRITGLRPEVK